MAIEFDYNLAISQANQIEAVANDMLGVSNRQLQTAVESIDACWRGDASRQFLSYCTATQTDVKTQAKALSDLARRIKEVARIIKEAEERAKELQRQAAAAAAVAGAAVATAAKDITSGS